jgi:type II secretory ATPase GspE/PulE/Tfp pilus assembly ATPase PilB-like protein
LAFIKEEKRLCHCSLAISGRPQDARISLPDRKLDIRVNLIPSLYGEKLVLRLLDQTRSFSLQDMGIDTAAQRAIQNALDNKTGVALLTGPTGSGKTTLLYSALASMNCLRLNIITIEDPIEYTFAGITQVQVSSRLSMNDALRAILRQDPDIILLGEIRDAESAALCFQAASTGHLVLSTLHANSAKEATTRLLTLGIDRDLIQSCLRFTSAQRLLPRLCLGCRLTVVGAEIQSEYTFYNRNLRGCSGCKQGAVGRIPILEFIQGRTSPNFESISSLPLKDLAQEAAKKGLIGINDCLTTQ